MPEYPQLQQNITPYGYYPKAPLTELMQVYRELTALGLYVVPKQRTKKLPVIRYWQKDKRAICTPDMALSNQKTDDVSGWCVVTGKQSSNLVVLDFDTAEMKQHGLDPYVIYEHVQELSPCNFVFSSPSGGVHLYYLLAEDKKLLVNAKPVKGMDIRGEGGQVVTLLGYNRYDNSDGMMADKKGVPDGHTDTYRKLVDGCYTSIPMMSDALYEWLSSAKKQSKPHEDVIGGKNYAKSEHGQERIDKHFKQAKTDRERVTLECLNYVLAEWDSSKNGYEQWFQMWMSAHHGSDGSPLVRDTILAHNNIIWRDGDIGRLHFRQAWNTHVYRPEDGYTVASLFWLARKAGWLSITGYEIPDALVTSFHKQYVSQWFDTLIDIPKRVLLQSQTGSGKTTLIKQLWLQLGKPKSVVFVPSVKLATELAHTLIKAGIPATLYIDPTTNKTLDSEVLIKAEFLVTTLQTFGTKVHGVGVLMSDYGLVYIEECDQLFSQFSLGDGGSHVSGQEAKRGYAVLRDAFASSGVVWGVDATMSRVSYDLAEAMKDRYTIEVFRNEWVQKKAPVTFVSSKDEAYQEMLLALNAGLRVVVVADTALIAEEAKAIMVESQIVKEDETIAITRPSERSLKVRAFMEDVNTEAAKYRLIAYNSCMASGVSITDVTPDLVIQICTYLTPRTNLQLLNRFRKQVKVICYYRMGESLYSKNAEEILSEAERRAWIESAQVKIPLRARNDDAILRAHIAALTIGDTYQQQRSAKQFYEALLKGDGRQIVTGDEISVSGLIVASASAVKDARKEYAAMLRSSWVNTPPIDRKRPSLASYTPIQVAEGEIHAEIERALRKNIPIDVSPETIYDTVYEFIDSVGPLSAFMEQDEALRRAELYLSDSGKAVTALKNNITLIRVLSTLNKLYKGLDDTLTSDKLAERAPKFMQSLLDVKDAYDAVTNRKDQLFTAVYECNDTDEERAIDFAKILLARIGLKQRMERSGRKGKDYSIKNAELARQFILWRMPSRVDDFAFSDSPITGIIDSRSEHVKIYEAMNLEDRERVTRLFTEERYTDFPLAVMTVHKGLDRW